MADVTYNVYRNDEKIASELTEKTYKDTGLEPETTYTYKVSAVNKYGESDLSDAVEVTTDAAPEPEPEPEPDPEEPDGGEEG